MRSPEAQASSTKAEVTLVGERQLFLLRKPETIQNMMKEVVRKYNLKRTGSYLGDNPTNQFNKSDAAQYAVCCEE